VPFLLVGSILVVLYLVILWLDRRRRWAEWGAEINEYKFTIHKLEQELASEQALRERAERELDETRRTS
jgi:hypothetical protein